MKILVIQLTRLGDIYQTWPVLRALKRNFPHAELHVLLRKRFESAIEGLEAVDKVQTLDTPNILESLVSVSPSAELAMERMAELCDRLVGEGYDQVINLSFSKFSSSLNGYLERRGVRALGYSRYQDQSLKISDTISAYFYAQVGRDRESRIHLVKIFAAVAEVELAPEDWRTPKVGICRIEDRITIQIGASEAHKTLSAAKWITLIRQLRSWWNGEVALVGSVGETHLSESICSSLPDFFVTNLVGKTNLQQCMEVVQSSRLVIAPDSLLIHMAALTQTPVLNLSASSVNFYETGPLSLGSRVLQFESEAGLLIDEASSLAQQILNSEEALDVPQHFLLKEDILQGLECYQSSFNGKQASDFSWQLIRALYFEGEIPKDPPDSFLQALEEIFEVNEVSQDCLVQIRAGKPVERFKKILERSDEVLQAIIRLVPATGPLIRKFFAEKVQIRPGSTEEILAATEGAHDLLQKEVVALWTEYKKSNQYQEGVL